MKTIMPLDDTQQEIINTSDILNNLKDNVSQVDNLMAKLLDKNIKRMIFIGSGDSYSIAQFMARCYESKLFINAKAMQSYEFIMMPKILVKADETAVFIITASGRPSPIIQALGVAKDIGAYVIMVTNHKNIDLCYQPDFILYTNAKKSGIPTQSTTATLFLLFQLMMSMEKNVVNQHFYNIDKLIDNISCISSTVNNDCINLDHTYMLLHPPIFLATGINQFIAEIGCNLLACGPQILSHSFLIEEFHHSLRLLHNNSTRSFILLLDDPKHQQLFVNTAKTLLSQGANVTLLSAIEIEESSLMGCNIIYFPVCSTYEYSFYSLIFLQVCTLKLSEYFVKQGGIRVKSIIDNGDNNEKI